MNQDLAIWSPVIVARLASPHHYRQKNSYHIGESYRRIEDLKVRIRSRQAQVQGKSVETKLSVVLLCLVEDHNGKLCPITREEILKERIPLSDFDQIPDRREDLHYLQDIENFSWDADLKGKYLNMSYYLTYMLMATQEQVVIIQPGSEGISYTNEVSPFAREGDRQADLITEENLKLRRQMHNYETNLESLKRGIQKAEINNTALSKELTSYKDMVEDLREAVKRKERIICSFENEIPLEKRGSPPLPTDEATLGKRIKRLFINNQ